MGFERPAGLQFSANCACRPIEALSRLSAHDPATLCGQVNTDEGVKQVRACAGLLDYIYWLWSPWFRASKSGADNCECTTRAVIWSFD